METKEKLNPKEMDNIIEEQNKKNFNEQVNNDSKEEGNDDSKEEGNDDSKEEGNDDSKGGKWIFNEETEEWEWVE